LNPYAVDAAYVCCGHVYIYRFGTTYSTRDKSYVRRHPFPCIALNFGFNVQMGSHHRFMFRSLSSTHRPRPMLRRPLWKAKKAGGSLPYHARGSLRSESHWCGTM